MLGRRIRLYVNHPIADEDGNVETFDRTQYRQVEWQHDSRNKDDDTAVYADILTIAPGSYHYYMIDHERLMMPKFGFSDFWGILLPSRFSRFLLFSMFTNQRGPEAVWFRIFSCRSRSYLRL